MKILYVVYFPPIKHTGNVAHTRGIISAWGRQVNELCILGPGWESYAPGNGRVVRAWQWQKRGFHTLSFVLAACPKFVLEVLRNRPHCVYARYFNLLFILAFVARLLKIPFFVEHNADTQAEHKMYRRGVLKRWFNNFAERTLLANCTGSVVVTQSLLDSWQKRYGGMRPNAAVIRNGVDSRIYTPRDRRTCQRELCLDESKFYVCYVGSFASVQGLRFLARAFVLVTRDFPTANLVLVGGQVDEIAQLEREVAMLGLSGKVHLISSVADTVAAAYMGAAHVCVAPYDKTVALWSGQTESGAPMKGDPLKIYSYMSCARPVVASHFREAGLHVQEIGAGLAVPPEDVEGLARAILMLLSDGSLSAEMGARGRSYVEAYATWDIVGRKTLEFLEVTMQQSVEQ